MSAQVLSIIQPKKPDGGAWRIETRWRPPPELAALGYPVQPWMHESGIFVLSAVEKVVAAPGHENVGPEYHLSISFQGGRCGSVMAKFALRAFGMEDATEDNHVPGGFVRNFWRPVADRFSGYECPCVETEPKIVEDKGEFVWRGVPK